MNGTEPHPNDPPTTDQRVEELNLGAARLIDAIEVLGKEAGVELSVLRKRQHHNRVVMWALITLAAIQIGVLAAVANLAYGTDRQGREIGELQQRTNNDVLCPLYGVFLASDTPAAHERALKERGPQGAAERKAAFKVIREGYAVLECQPTFEEKHKGRQ